MPMNSRLAAILFAIGAMPDAPPTTDRRSYAIHARAQSSFKQQKRRAEKRRKRR